MGITVPVSARNAMVPVSATYGPITNAIGYGSLMAMGRLRAGLYERVSTGIQDASLSRSIETQNQSGRYAVQRHNWLTAGRYADPALSASKYARKSRPEWQRLLSDISARLIDVVVMWEAARGSRELEDWARFLNLCANNGVLIFITQDDYLYDPSDARDWKTLADAGVDSAHESNRTSRRSRDGVATAAAKGEPYGRIPYGYMRRYEHDPTRKKGRRAIQEPHPEHAPIVREIITRIAQGVAVSAIVTDLFERGILSPTGKPRWSRSSVVRLVTEGFVYIGKRRHKDGPLLDGDWPAIVDTDIYWAAVTVLSDPARKASLKNGGGIRPGRSRWLQTYITTCAVCHGPLSVKHLPRAGSGKVPHYRCVGKGCASAPVDWLDFVVTMAVVRWCSQPIVYEVIIAGESREALAAKAEADAERNRLAEFERQAIAGKISAAMFARVTAGIEDRIRRLDNQAEMAASLPELRGLVAVHEGSQQAREEDIYERWLAMPLPAQRRVLRTLAAPELSPAGDNPEDPFRIKMNFKVRHQRGVLHDTGRVKRSRVQEHVECHATPARGQHHLRSSGRDVLRVLHRHTDARSEVESGREGRTLPALAIARLPSALCLCRNAPSCL